ncbi:MAG: RdgB/HAM1 family non-canonical purine NTP pyrophosphatase [Lachnospiraceae bacterium]|jgi:XTP/dITP diphosphohydrolase|nr:RdgB/HAM1 family non-canonical purine NTP pyrophosphatase [Lachnospiraceae bacterium]MBQ3906767.1 RdgB/HAM1 family non-canonical purine NTP pyrophosphatase [Lachnospiraceae bacterium]
MSNQIIFATGNKGKVKEIEMILADAGYEIRTMKEAGIALDINENGTTYEENALIKVRAVAAHPNAAGCIVMADDSGLEVDALNKEPGVYSARYLGEDTPYSIKNAEIIKRLNGVPDEKRTARFACAIAAKLPDGSEIVTKSTIEGRIGYEEKGSNGFGYDPIFFYPPYGKHTAELTEAQKNEVSHRGKALRLMKEELGKVEKH